MPWDLGKNDMLNKKAFLQGLKDQLVAKFSDPKFTHEKAIPVLDALTSHHAGSAAGGAVLGGLAGLTGTALQKKKKPYLKNTLLGILGGGAAGLGGSFVAPELSKAINEALVANTIRPAAGRVVTNAVSPHTYTHNDNDATDPFYVIKQKRWKDMLRAAIKDEPVYKENPLLMNSSEPIYRKSFGLKPRTYQNYLSPTGPDTWKYNMEDPDGRLAADLSNLLTPVQLDKLRYGPVGTKQLGENFDMGNFWAEKSSPTTLKYQDKWDFDLHGDEALNSKSTWARYFLDRLIKKQTMVGEASIPGSS